MQSTRRSLTIGVVLLLTFSYLSMSVTAQSDSVENHPTSDDPYMYFWGSESLDDCWNNFDNLSEGSASEGYGEILFPEGQDVSIDFSCELQTGFSDDFILELNETISIAMKFNIQSGNCGGEECDLTLTLFRGEELISEYTESANSVNGGNDFTTSWDITVSEAFQSWSKDTSTTISVSYQVPAETGIQCNNPGPFPVPGSDCSGSFRMYYSDEGGDPGEVHVEFPIFVSLLDSEANIGKTSIGPMLFIIPFILMTVLLGWVAYREDWMKGSKDSSEPFEFTTWCLDTLDTINPLIWAPKAAAATSTGFIEWRKGGALTENTTRRVVTLCVMYFAQGLPWGFATVTFAAYLIDNGTPVEDIAVLFATVALPWTFKWIWGPVVDSIFIEKYGPRRQWVLFAQTGMALTLGSLFFVDDLNEQVGLVTRVLFIHNIFASLQDVATDALAVEILQPDEVAKVNGFMFAAKRAGEIIGGAGLGILVTEIDISGVILAQLSLLLLIVWVPLTMVEKPGVKLFPWSKIDAIILDSNISSEVIDNDNTETPWVDEEIFLKAKSVGYSVSERRISITAFFTIIGLLVWFSGFAIDVFTIDWEFGSAARNITNPVSYTSLAIALLLFSYRSFMDYLDNENPLPEVPNPFSMLPVGTKNTVARTSFYLVKAFSVRSALILVGLCLLANLYIFVEPIKFDIFINGAGWSQAKYNGIIGGIVVLGAMVGQIFGGFLGDRYGTRRVAMVFFLILALANASLAFLEPLWGNTTIMTIFLILQTFVAGIAWICIISLTMRLTWSKVGGTQFTAYMSLFNLSAVFAYSLTGSLIAIFDYSSAIYLGALLTMAAVIMLIFIDESETDRVLEGRIKDDDEWEEEDPDTDLGERPEWWTDEDLQPTTS